ncbi:M23 family metallopeptidase [Nonomuraea sp. NPDC023979]|uniref:M23 family metallopeptidase n=1 Tax=Nonomuraea sp. NPDC023979 TaxID=3154796 RepID=UPI0033F928F4
MPRRPSPRTTLRFLAIILALTCAVLVPTTPATADRPPWRWPLDGTPRILSRFAPPPAPWLAGHRGVDLAAPAATPVLAAGPGTVGFAGPVAGRGVVTVNHADGLRTTYLPVIPAVRRGDPVALGDRLGAIAPSPPPHCPESCLHWGLKRDTTYLDPLLLLARAPVRLLPFWQSLPPAQSQASTLSPKTEQPRTPTPAPAPGPEQPPALPFLPRSASTPAPPSIALAALIGTALLLFLLIRRHRPRPPEGRHSKRRTPTADPPPTPTGQHRKPRRPRRRPPR